MRKGSSGDDDKKQDDNSKSNLENDEHPLQTSLDAIFDKCSTKEDDVIEICGTDKHLLQLFLHALPEKRPKEDQLAEEIQSNGRKALQKYLDALFEKRKASREKALLGLVDAFSRNSVLEFAENNYVTLQHQLIQLIIRGASIEVSEASRALGLLAITLGHGEGTYEIMKDSVTNLSQALSSSADSSTRISVIECLSILTFVGANRDEETYKSMEIIWQFIHSKTGPIIEPNDDATFSELAAAISSWSLLLTTIARLKIHASNWQESISFLSNLMDKENPDLRIAIGHAIGLVYEIGGLKELCYETKICTDSQSTEQKKGFSCQEGLKIQIQNVIRKQSLEAADGAIVNSERKLFVNLLAFLETGTYPKTSIKICKKGALLEVASWSQHIQLKFLWHMLGSGFTNHMQNNEFLHDIFNVGHKKQRSSGTKEFTSDNYKDTDLCYIPQVMKAKHARHAQKLYRSPSSVFQKAKTKKIRQERLVAQARNNGYYASGEEDF